MREKTFLIILFLFAVSSHLNAQAAFQLYSTDNVSNPEAIFDHQISGNFSVIGNQKKSFVIFDAKRIVEINRTSFYFHSVLPMNQFKKEVLDEIVFLYSSDIVGWQKLNEKTFFEVVGKGNDIYEVTLDLPPIFLQYIKLSFESVPDKTIVLTEVIFDSPDLKPLEIISAKLKTDPDKRTSAELLVQFNRPVKCQVKYDSNYNYVYSKSLDHNLMNVYEEPTQRFTLSNLMPNTTYVYKITAQADGQELESPVYKFSTVKQ